MQCKVKLGFENREVFKPHQLLVLFSPLELAYFSVADERGRVPRLQPSISGRILAPKLSSCRVDEDAQERVRADCSLE